MTTAVAIALYNGEAYLHKQLECIRKQTKTPNQVVLCDDGSKDHTVQIVMDYIEKHQLQDSWKLVVNKENLGYARNFFHAMALCDADLVFLCDQDDLWKEDKIEKMTEVMQQQPDIQLLSCKFEIIDGNDTPMQGLLTRKPKQTGTVTPVRPEELLRGFYWLGMLMCVRKIFLDQILPDVSYLDIAHDRILSHCAADKCVFYEYDYVGAYHRRHNNNAAREEHRISKLLNLPRKLREIVITKKLWSDMLAANLPISSEHRALIERSLKLLEGRETALKTRSLRKVASTYSTDRGSLLRKASMLSDIWLVLFGKREK